MKVSIVVTTYRRPAMLAELLEALRPQLVDRAAEAIIVDNCPGASARPVIDAQHDRALRYVHESRSGVVHSRNRGVAEATGTYVIFLDDDEVPCADWLDAFLAQADGINTLSFGRIVPRLLDECPAELCSQVERAFGRDFRQPTGADITRYAAHLGTGNAMFHKAHCLGKSAPFDVRFNARGGEDVWLIRQLVATGHRLTWNNDALVEEQVPAERMTFDYLRARRFNQGQIRCVLVFGKGGPGGVARAAAWMLVGLAQVVIFGTAAWAATILAPHRVPDLKCRTSGGAGKLLWWRTPTTSHYGVT